MKIKNRLYTVKFDGELLSYKCTGLSCYLFGMFGLTKHFEIPVNTLLHLESKPLAFLNLIKLYINHYSHGQQKLTTRRIAHFALVGFSRKQVRNLISQLDQAIETNLSSEANLGLSHISKSELALFYSKLHKPQAQTARKESALSGMTNMRITKRPNVSQAS